MARTACGDLRVREVVRDKRQHLQLTRCQTWGQPKLLRNRSSSPATQQLTCVPGKI